MYSLISTKIQCNDILNPSKPVDGATVPLTDVLIGLLTVRVHFSVVKKHINNKEMEARRVRREKSSETSEEENGEFEGKE